MTIFSIIYLFWNEPSNYIFSVSNSSNGLVLLKEHNNQKEVLWSWIIWREQWGKHQHLHSNYLLVYMYMYVCICINACICIYVNKFSNLSALTPWDTRSIFKWSLIGLNSEFTGCHTRLKSQSTQLFIHSWIHNFLKSIRAIWNANSFV